MAITKAHPAPQTPSAHRIVVDVGRQTLRVMDGASMTAEFPVSTSRFGLGCEEGSFRTPTGRFVVRAKIGQGAPAWTVFRARESTGELAVPGGEASVPMSADAMQSLLDAGGLTGDELVWREGWADWVSIRLVFPEHLPAGG